MRRRVVHGVRFLVLLCLLMALPLTSGWVAVYVLGGIAVLAGGLCCCGCCCSSCCEDACADCGCDCDCDGCGGEGCCDDCCGDDCCGGSDSGSEGSCATMPDEMAMAVPLLAWCLPRAAWWQRRLAHHPLRPDFAHDVYPLGPLRLCIGCFTTYPVFLAAAAWLLLAAPGAPWWTWTTGGLALASAQGISAAGLARRRWHKGTIKTALGLGLAATTYGILQAPWRPLWQSVGLLVLLALALASAVPRAIRMRRHRTR